VLLSAFAMYCQQNEVVFNSVADYNNGVPSAAVPSNASSSASSRTNTSSRTNGRNVTNGVNAKSKRVSYRGNIAASLIAASIAASRGGKKWVKGVSRGKGGDNKCFK
jgi:hypothetical protein